MPKIDIDAVETEIGSTYPEPYASQMGGRAFQALGDAAGLSEIAEPRTCGKSTTAALYNGWDRLQESNYWREVIVHALQSLAILVVGVTAFWVYLKLRQRIEFLEELLGRRCPLDAIRVGYRCAIGRGEQFLEVAGEVEPSARRREHGSDAEAPRARHIVRAGARRRRRGNRSRGNRAIVEIADDHVLV